MLPEKPIQCYFLYIKKKIFDYQRNKNLILIYINVNKTLEIQT